MYSLSEREKQLGLGEKGVTKYFSPNCHTSDSDIVNKYLKAKSIEGIHVG
jgi:dipeptidyl-peptidase-3